VTVPVVVGLALGERPTALAAIGILAAITAVVLISQTGAIEAGKRPTTGLAVAIASGIAIGFFLVCLERSGDAAGLWPLIVARIASVSCFALAAVKLRERLRPRQGSLAIVLGGGALDMIANALYLVAVRHGPLSIVATLASLYPASTILLARIVLRERLRLLQQAGVACAAVAVVLIVAGR
jgi:drug/metabolite transporter (DMT)-like permease